MRLPVRILLIHLFLGVCGAEAASPSAEETAIQKGNSLRRAGDDQAALPFYRSAYDVAHSPKAAAQLGLCEMALGQWPSAEIHVTDALRAHEQWIDRNRVTLEDALRTIKGRVGRLEIVGEPAGTTVTVNGEVVGQLPLGDMLRVSAGSMQIEGRAPGFRPKSVPVTIAGAQYQRVTLYLERDAEALRPSPPPAPATQSDVALSDAAVNDSGPHDRAFYQRSWFWWGLGGVVVAGTIAAVALSMSGTRYPDANQRGTAE